MRDSADGEGNEAGEVNDTNADAANDDVADDLVGDVLAEGGAAPVGERRKSQPKPATQSAVTQSQGQNGPGPTPNAAAGSADLTKTPDTNPNLGGPGTVQTTAPAAPVGSSLMRPQTSDTRTPSPVNPNSYSPVTRASQGNNVSGQSLNPGLSVPELDASNRNGQTGTPGPPPGYPTSKSAKFNPTQTNPSNPTSGPGSLEEQRATAAGVEGQQADQGPAVSSGQNLIDNLVDNDAHTPRNVHPSPKKAGQVHRRPGSTDGDDVTPKNAPIEAALASANGDDGDIRMSSGSTTGSALVKNGVKPTSPGNGRSNSMGRTGSLRKTLSQYSNSDNFEQETPVTAAMNELGGGDAHIADLGLLICK